jgi:hypothetical protein
VRRRRKLCSQEMVRSTTAVGTGTQSHLCVLGQDDPQCSMAGGYRGNERGEAPRPACRGTGCREWRRGMSQLEHAAFA